MNEMKEFYKILMDYFVASRKASWKKQEVVSKIKDLYIEELEKKDERPKGPSGPRITGSPYDQSIHTGDKPYVLVREKDSKPGEPIRDPYEPE